jgi:hypothetical protein
MSPSKSNQPIGGTLSVVDEATMDSGKPSTISALRMGVFTSLLKKPPQNAATTKAMVSVRPTVCKPLKMSQDELQGGERERAKLKIS